MSARAVVFELVCKDSDEKSCSACQPGRERRRGERERRHKVVSEDRE